MDELSMQKMYDSLMEKEAMENSFGMIDRNLRRFDPEDAEVFITSKEIAQAKAKEKEDPKRPYRHNEEPETIHFKKYGTRRIHKYTEKEMEAIKASCVSTIVHDYGNFDWYHVSNEERIKHDELAEISLKLAKLKRTYRRVDQYIEAMRVVYQAWEILSNMNFIHTKEEFFRMVSKGKIISNRIIMPKLKCRSNYNMDMIIGYISNPELDVSHLAPKIDKFDMFIPDDEIEDPEDEMKRLLSPEEAEYALEHEETPEPLEVEFFKQKMVKGYADRNMKRKKRESKFHYKVRKDLAHVLKKIESGNHYNNWGRSFMVTNSIFEKEKKGKDFWEKMPFEGSWSKKKDIFMYELASDLQLMNEAPEGERYLTYGDKQTEMVFRILEDAGVNTIELRRNMAEDTSIITQKATKKENKRMEAAIIQRIEKLNESKEFRKIAKRAEEALAKYNKGE